MFVVSWILGIADFLFKQIWEANFNFDLKMNEEEYFTFSYEFTESYERIYVLEIKQYAIFGQEMNWSASLDPPHSTVVLFPAYIPFPSRIW